MKVHELIEELQKYDGETPIQILVHLPINTLRFDSFKLEEKMLTVSAFYLDIGISSNEYKESFLSITCAQDNFR